MDKKILVGQKLLRCGYTTGSCAAAATKAAVRMLLSKQIQTSVSIETPNETKLILDVLAAEMQEEKASCAIQKDSGDDPDVTNGIWVYATVSRIQTGIEIEGGQGIGRVTKAGLDQPIGAAAINSVPRSMIQKEAEQAAKEAGYEGGLRVVISIPEGEGLAGHTFNPRMGIIGGISVLGTSGIVEPMSDTALVDTIRTEVSMLAAQGKKALLFTLGNYGEAFARETLQLPLDANVKCSNFIGDALAAGMEHGIANILIVGHIGKLVKLGIGLFNTHSNNGDGRMETMLACAVEAGATIPLLQEILECVTVDAALEHMHEQGLLRETMEVLKRRISYHLSRKALPETEIGFVCFTNTGEYRGILTQSDNAEELMKRWRGK